MKIRKLSSCLFLALLLTRLTSAAIVGPYAPDANTPFLFHFNNSGSSVLTNLGTVGGNAYTVSIGNGGGPAIAVTNVTTLMNGSPYSAAFTNAISFPFTNNGYMVAFVGASNAFTTDTGSTGTRSPNAIAESVLGIGTSANSPWTIEAMIKPAVTNFNQEIVCMDSYAATAARGIQFKINTAGQLQFQTIGGTAYSQVAGIPATGANAFVPGTWYHVAVVYNGSTMQLYWTAISSSVTAAATLGSALTPASGSMGTTQGAITGPLILGNRDRLPAMETFNGEMDEVRISSVARGAGQMLFAPSIVTLTQQPVGLEGVDYGTTGILTVSASSSTTMGYQWYRNGAGVTGATNATLVFTNATQANAGNYYCVVTNITGSSATSSSGQVLIGAANYLTNRYSFDSDATDSIGGQNGTVNGGYTFNGNSTLTLDGSSGYVALPANIINTNMGAVTIETWAGFGSLPANTMLFAFGDINGSVGTNYIFATPHGANARIAITGGTGAGEQQAIAGSPLDNDLNVQIVAVFAPYAGYEALYTNGVLAAINTNVTWSLAALVDNFSYIGQSLYSADPHLACTLDEFRIYDGALSAASVQQSYLQGAANILSDGPVQIVSSPTNLTVAQGLTATFAAVVAGHQPMQYQWLKNGSPITGATNATYSYAAVYADNNATFQVLATNLVGGATYAAASDQATLTVLVPETLAWLGASDYGWNESSLNWSNSAQSVVAYVNFDGVVLDDRGASQPTIDLQFAATPVAMTISNNAASYVLTSYSLNGTLDVLGTLWKKNAGTFVLDVTNLSTGPTVIQGGTLQVGNGDTYGTLGSGPVTNSSMLAFYRADAITVANDIHGSGTVTYNSGTTTLASTNNDYTGATLINSGAMVDLTTSATLGATNGGTTVNSGGQLYLTANVNVGLEPLTLYDAGGDGNGALRKGGAGTSVYNGKITLADAVTVGVDTGATLVLSNTVLGAGGLTVYGLGTLALNAPGAYTGGTTLTSGILDVNASGALGTGAVYANSGSSVGRIVLGTGIVLTNAITADSVNPAAATGFLMVNDNTNNAVTTISGPLTFNAGAATGGHFYGPTTSGYLNVSGPVTLSSGFIVVRAGNLRFAGGGSYPQIQVRANTTSLGANNGLATSATLDLAGNGTAYFDLNGFNQWLAGLQNTVTPANLGWVTNSSATQGTLTLDVGAGNTESFGGGIVGNVALVVNSGTQTLTTNGVATSGSDTYTGNTTINAGATLAIGNGVVLSNTTNLVVNGTLDVSAAGLKLAPAQTIKGSGAVTGSVTGGGAAPGGPAAIGSLTLSGSLVLNGLTTFKVNPAAGTSDLLSVAGGLTYGGKLYATNLGGSLSVGRSFTVVSAGSQSGNFASITGSPGAGKAWAFTNGVLSVVAASPTNLTFKVTGNQIVVGWPADYVGWQLQTQTNAATHGLGTNWVNVANSTTVNSVTNAISNTVGAQFYRLIFNQ